MRYFIKFSYLGKQYRGLQKNIIAYEDVLMHDPDTIQGALEGAFSTLHPKCIRSPKICCSSRTDVGVHALCNTAHVDIENISNSIYEPNNVLRYVNRHLISSNHTIRLLEFIPVENTFHARHLAKSRTYIYRFLVPKDINNCKIPIGELNQCLFVRSSIVDIEKIKRGTQLFMGTKNFKTFSAKKISKKPINYIRNLNSLTIEKGSPLMPFDELSKDFEFWNIVCSAQGFLYNQVRRIVSSLLDLGAGVITERDINIMLQVPGHHNWNSKINMIPGFGLYLTNVEYCQEQIDKYIIKYKPSPDELTIIPLDSNDI